MLLRKDFQTGPNIGQPAPVFQLPALAGGEQSLEAFRGKAVILNFWATWCGPCRSEMPTLVKMQDQHRDAGLEVIGINTDDETVQQINDFVAEMNLNYQIVWGDTQLQAALLNISKFPGIPQSFIIDRDGNLRGVFKGANPDDVRKMEALVAKVVADV